MAFRMLCEFFDERRNVEYGDIRHEFSEFIDIEKINMDSCPECSGCYLMRSSNVGFTYPWGLSGLFYIGTSKKLKDRLGVHRQGFIEARSNKRIGNTMYYPRYEYGAVYGCEISYSCSDEITEGDLLERFCSRYGAIPVANTQHTDLWHRFPAK